MIVIYPTPQRYFDPKSKQYNPDLGDFALGGKYLTENKEDITGYVAENAILSTYDKPIFRAKNITTNLPSRDSINWKLRINLFKQSAGWKWISLSNPSVVGIRTIISVELKNKHFYCVNINFKCPLILERYPLLKTEPRLRPTCFIKNIRFTQTIGSITIRKSKNLKNVYESIFVE